MALNLQKIREYWQATADTCEPLVLKKSEAEILNFAANHEVSKAEAAQPANDLLLAAPELINERIYILASDMNLPHLWAEAVVRLQAMNRPASIPQNSWLDIQEACNQLYRDNFGLLKLIITHEWQLSEIFGCHPSVPLIRVDMMGLLLLLHQGDEIVGINKEKIKILRKTGSMNVFSRRLEKPTRGRVLLHELAR